MTSVARALALVGDARVVGVAGPPGAGKSTLGAGLARALHAVLVPMDGFHLPQATLIDLGRRDRMGAPDTFDRAAFVAVLRRIRTGEAVEVPAFDRTLEQPVPGAIHVPARSRVVIEGNYLLLWPEVRELLDVALYLPGDAQRLRRLRDRHIAFGKTPDEADAWIATVDEPNAVLVAASAVHADAVLD